MSLQSNTGGHYTAMSPDSTHHDGRTPPLAPGSAFARRTRELRDEDSASFPLSIGDYGGDEEPGSESSGSTYGSSYRRARAGTLPSRLPEPSQQYIPAEELTPTLAQIDPQVPFIRTSALSPAHPPATPVARPTLRHTASSAANLETPSNGNRNRSGSLTLPQNGIGKAFGSSPFSSTWLANPGLTTGQSRSPLGHPSLSHEEELRALMSPSDSGNSLATDDVNSTLDYLGLADGQEGHLAPASMTELLNQAKRAIDTNGPASRLRANTVSNFARPYRPSVTNVSPYGQDHGGYDDHQEEEILINAMDHMGMYDPGLYLPNPALTNLYSPSNLLKDAHRPRATTVGTLDNPMRRSGGRNYLSAIPQSPMHANYSNPMMMDGRYGYGPRSRSDRDLTRSRDSSASRGPRLSISSHTSRAGTPDVDRTGSSTPQMPTRSLWIGNLDVNATSEALLHVFAPYGAIESLRMLPEKTCAFVNFMEKGDAIKARDDVLNRLGGHLTALSETAPVRIGFGKIDSAPSGPPTSTIAPAPPGLVFTNGPGTPNSITVPPMAVSAAQMVNTPDQGPGNEQSALPTRALWVGSIPSTTSSATLLQIFSPFGPVESARILSHKSCGFVNFERLDSAISARQALNGRDILGSDIGAIRIGFARVPVKTPQIGGPEDEEQTTPKADESLSGLGAVKGAAAVSTEKQLSVEGGGVENYRSQLVLDLVKAGVHEQVLEKGLGNEGVVSEQQMIMQVLGGGQEDQDGDVRAAAELRGPVTYYTSIPIITDRPATRRFDAARLRDLRKRIDSGLCRQEEIDDITRDTLEECAELASDYIGNTVIQKLFERTSPPLRMAMLERIAPHLAMIGVHKNGTWAAQKIIECSVTDEERALVVMNLRAYCPPLMSDSLGNYVCAGTLRFGEPHNGYVFDAMIDRMWDIAQNRFGARCMRTCLESPHTSLYQRKRIATSVILNSIPLATNPNGALLLTWLVDQSNLPGRYGLLANRFAPHVTHLCTHKLASLTVLRIINQISEPGASSTLINAIFTSPNDQVLTDVLSDANNGSQVIGKILAMSTLTPTDKELTTTSVRRVLPNIKASSTPPYRRLLEEVGLPVPVSSSLPSQSGFSPHRPQNQQASSWNQHQPYIPQQHQHQHQGHGHGSFNPYAQPAGMFGANNSALSPLLMPQNMSLGQAMRHGSPGLGGSPRTPQPTQRGRLSPGSQMMSPGSDPFNPFASPSIDVPYLNQNGHSNLRLSSSLIQPPVTFEPQPNLGGLGILSQNQGNEPMYYPQGLGRNGMYAQAGFQA